MSVWYLDVSAIVQLVLDERESDALEAWWRTRATVDVLATCELAGIVTYDTRMADAACALGLPVLAPGT